MIRTPLAILALGALALGACGKVGSLDQPAPLFGEKAKARYEAQKAADAAAKAHKNDKGEPQALPADPNQDLATAPGTQRAHPIEGQRPDPFAAPPRGALPDPMSQPEGPR